MISGVFIRNFRGFRSLNAERCTRFNLIVGDSGSGKTSLLEAIFFAMGASPELAARFRVQRGLPAAVTGSAKSIQEAFWGDLFYASNLDERISIKLTGSGPEARSLEIYRGLDDEPKLLSLDNPESSPGPDMTLKWTDSHGEARYGRLSVNSEGFKLQQTGEDLPDFYYFPSNHSSQSAENAARFSYLSKRNLSDDFVSIVVSEFGWVTSLGLEVWGGSPTLFVGVRGVDVKLPISTASSGLNKFVSHLLAVVTSQSSVLLIDEIENGIYYSKYAAYWRAIAKQSSLRNNQIFATTHSLEMLRAVAESLDDIGELSLWRLVHEGEEIFMEQFDGFEFREAIDRKFEVR